MPGKTAVRIILPESLGPRYNWTGAELAQATSGVKTPMVWWASQEPNAGMSSAYQEEIRAPTVYEPIEMNPTEDSIWTGDVMSRLGYGSDELASTPAFNNAIRNQYGTDRATSRPTTTMASKVALKMPTVVTVRTTHLYSMRWKQP